MCFGSTPQVTPGQVTPKTVQSQFTGLEGFTNLTGTSFSNTGDITQSPWLQGTLAGLSQTFQQQAGNLSSLAGTVAPGFSQARQAGMATLESQYANARSNLSQSLAQRRILGSSFADSALSNLDAQKAQDEANFQANSYFQETQQYFQITQAQYQAAASQFSTQIGQANIDSGLAAQLVSQNNSIAAQIASANAQLQTSAATTNANLQAQSQAGIGKAVGTGLGAAAAIGLAPFTGGASLAALPGVLSGTPTIMGGYGSSGYANAPSIFTNPVATIYPNPNAPGQYSPGYA